MLIKVPRCGICGSDAHIFRGDFPVPNLPLTIGHEFAGMVAAVGPGVSPSSPGTRRPPTSTSAAAHAGSAATTRSSFALTCGSSGCIRPAGWPSTSWLRQRTSTRCPIRCHSSMRRSSSHWPARSAASSA
ncbi:MAG: alcohol dehydrogenase catalytic domain-containing protein [Hyphomicrobiales bacterium]|nr:alcohol dehydrogenase catalytic domain-containing protein [Hyphomicrobiales bacterium]